MDLNSKPLIETILSIQKKNGITVSRDQIEKNYIAITYLGKEYEKKYSQKFNFDENGEVDVEFNKLKNLRELANPENKSIISSLNKIEQYCSFLMFNHKNMENTLIFEELIKNRSINLFDINYNNISKKLTKKNIDNIEDNMIKKYSNLNSNVIKKYINFCTCSVVLENNNMIKNKHEYNKKNKNLNDDILEQCTEYIKELVIENIDFKLRDKILSLHSEIVSVIKKYSEENKKRNNIEQKIINLD
ncbi:MULTISPECIES: hypothetical protein [unclassified Campylobacter]|uniref:hypothetical protein n=1 Tax=unclassified Campylobacter TaxID=2593542 RepID=UPI001DEE9D32|nr:hypothetical protein [Campylobacter sp. RM9331]MBZ8006254.1 hypothetical protein [Campylobacter sp. RM9332]